MPIKPVIVIHGGAGAIARTHMDESKQANYEQALREIVIAGQTILQAGGSAVDAVTQAVCMLEDSPLFNAGKGAVYTSAKTHELDASIMDGSNLRSGAVAGIRHIRNPVLLARAVMEKSPHVFFHGQGAEDFAREQGLEWVDSSYFHVQERLNQLLQVQAKNPAQVVLDHDAKITLGGPLDETQKMGTVGAVALDINGHLAAATSTGGMTNKRPGRIGDSPIIGAGCYANDLACAVSATGTGEMFIRSVAAYDVAAQMLYAHKTLEEATNDVILHKIPSLGGDGGLIAVDTQGNIAMPFHSEGMYRGYGYADAEPMVAIYK